MSVDAALSEKIERQLEAEVEMARIRAIGARTAVEAATETGRADGIESVIDKMLDYQASLDVDYDNATKAYKNQYAAHKDLYAAHTSLLGLVVALRTPEDKIEDHALWLEFDKLIDKLSTLADDIERAIDRIEPR